MLRPNNCDDLSCHGNMAPVKRYILAVLALLLALPLVAQESNRNVRFGLPSPAKDHP